MQRVANMVRCVVTPSIENEYVNYLRYPSLHRQLHARPGAGLVAVLVCLGSDASSESMYNPYPSSSEISPSSTSDLLVIDSSTYAGSSHTSQKVRTRHRVHIVIMPVYASPSSLYEFLVFVSHATQVDVAYGTISHIVLVNRCEQNGDLMRTGIKWQSVHVSDIVGNGNDYRYFKYDPSWVKR